MNSVMKNFKDKKGKDKIYYFAHWIPVIGIFLCPFTATIDKECCVTDNFSQFYGSMLWQVFSCMLLAILIV